MVTGSSAQYFNLTIQQKSKFRVGASPLPHGTVEGVAGGGEAGAGGGEKFVS